MQVTGAFLELCRNKYYNVELPRRLRNRGKDRLSMRHEQLSVADLVQIP